MKMNRILSLSSPFFSRNSFVDRKGFFFDPTIFEKDKMRLSYLLEKMLIFLFFS